MPPKKHIVLQNVQDEWIGTKLAIHEASHAVMTYLVFGHSAIKYVSVNASFLGAVHLMPFLTNGVFDLVRLRTAVAGYLGESIHATEHLKRDGGTATPGEIVKDDLKLVEEIIMDNELSVEYLQAVKEQVRLCLRLPFIKQAVLDLADLLYEKLYRTVPYRQKRVKGPVVEQCILASLASSVVKSKINVNQLLEKARRLVQMKPIDGKTTACCLNWKPLTEDYFKDGQ